MHDFAYISKYVIQTSKSKKTRVRADGGGGGG